MSTVEPETLTIAEAAAKLGVSRDAVTRWIKSGALKIFRPPGVSLNDGRRGPKSIRIPIAEWENFLRAHTVSAGQQVAIPEAQKPTRGTPLTAATGTDGISRRNRSRQG